VNLGGEQPDRVQHAILSGHRGSKSERTSDKNKPCTQRQRP
jgi:hypothetical protein